MAPSILSSNVRSDLCIGTMIPHSGIRIRHILPGESSNLDPDPSEDETRLKMSMRENFYQHY